MLQLRFKYLLACLLAAWLIPAAAQQDFFATIETDMENDVAESKGWNYKGYVKQEFKYGFQVPDPALNSGRDAEGLNQVQTDVFGEFRGDINKSLSYRLGFKGELQYVEWEDNDQQWQVNGEELFLKDAFIDAVFADGQWLRVGHQVFAWGESESLAISDVLAPYDLREFGQTELRDIREPIPAVFYSHPIGDHKISLVTSWQARANRYADKGREFYPYAGFDNLGLIRKERNPEKEWELALRYERYLNGGDIRFVAAEVNDNEWHYVLPTGSGSGNTVFMQQARVKVLAVAANRVVGSWQLKAELGMHWDKARNLDNGQLAVEDQWRGMLGVEYTGIDDWQFSYEINAVSVRDSSIATSDDSTEPGQVIRIQQTAWNERLTQQLWWIDLLDDGGQVMRWDLSYDWNDHWAFAADVVVYRNSNDDSVFYPFRHNDSFNVSATYHF